MTEIITFSISPELREKVDKERGDIPRSKFVSRILEDAIRIKERNMIVDKKLVDRVEAETSPRLKCYGEKNNQDPLDHGFESLKSSGSVIITP